MAETTFAKKCEILGDFWMTHRYDPKFTGWIAYSDLALPLAYAIANDIVKTSGKAEEYVNDSFKNLIEDLGIADSGFESLEQLRNAASHVEFEFDDEG